MGFVEPPVHRTEAAKGEVRRLRGAIVGLSTLEIYTSNTSLSSGGRERHRRVSVLSKETVTTRGLEGCSGISSGGGKIRRPAKDRFA
jgi:hypothetical protein